MKLITLNIDGNEKQYNLEENNLGIPLKEIAKDFEDKHKGKICIASVDNKLRELNYNVFDDCKIKFIDTTEEDGKRVYFRALSFILVMACKELFGDGKVVIEHSLSKGLYCEVHIGRDLNEVDLENIKRAMQEKIDKNYEIEKVEMSRDEAIEIFNENKLYSKAELLKYKDYDSTTVYKCGDYIDHYYGYMLPSTGDVSIFNVELHNKGLILFGPNKNDKTVPTKYVSQPKLANIYYETEQWSKLLGIDKVVSLNRIVENNEYGDVIRTVEALHEKKLAQIADEISKYNKRIILIAAPSSSGKTSFANRLSIHLRVNNLNPISISLDNYFVDREFTPLDELGNFDFESIYAIDLDKFNSDLKKLLDGEEIQEIKFDFKTGKRVETNKTIQIDKNQPIILEGIHGLNPMLTESIDDDEKFKIYLSALTQLNLDNHNRIPTTDLRLIRRIVRDHNFRGYSAEKTILQWESVRRGEKKNIFPYQEEADIIFNSACVYELSILKGYVKPLLEEIETSSEAYIESNRLLNFLQYFVELEDISDIPSTSILREFIGGSKIVEE
ncbi:nucleoside kinase [Metaclostridioides mangenotii]|uniref:Uridine kinase n=1 Tax=Metaclostridioides mangenotii TaxID=1540 RepID=A0ABS4ECE1_9FIRM|nr:nucleoside kinase [Clostridioides mangenotii]MBP1855589.1 uridine kinase [Clostridioides mangenotii]